MNYRKSDSSNNRYIFITLILILLNLFSSLSVIYIHHLNRISMAKLQKLSDIQHQLYKEWTQLILEQNTLISYNRVDKIAANKFNMRLPKNSEILYLNINQVE